jgi:sorbitol/mannitol transport system substrate-binding protein
MLKTDYVPFCWRTLCSRKGGGVSARWPERLVAATALMLAFLLAGAGLRAQTTLTIATVNNGDMIAMQRLSRQFEQQHPDIHLDWVMLEENILREKTTTDAATHGGQYDVVTIGPLETPIWGRRGWLLSLGDKLSPSYDVDDLLKPIRDGASDHGRLYALPFYAESSLTYYRKDLFAAAGLTMPAHPTYEDIERFAKALNDPAKDVYGVCLRGKPGWGENIAYVTTVANTFGGRWFNESWKSQLDSAEWHNAVSLYVNLLQRYGPPGSSSNGFNELLTLFENGRCGMWIDATVAAGALSNSKQSKVADAVGFAPAPVAVTPRGAQWLWFWALAVPSSTKHADAAIKFVEWATSREYIRLVAQTDGWAAVPPGTRRSTYEQPEYLAAAPFAGLVYRSIMAADPLHPTLDPVPYTGIQVVVIPAFPTIGNQVGQILAGALVGNSTVDEALHKAQAATERVIQRMGVAQ